MNWSFELMLWRLQKKRFRTAALYSKLYRKAKMEKKPQDELESIRGEALMEDQLSKYEIESHVTWALISRAEQLFLPIPASDEEGLWKEAYVPDKHVLTPLGVSKLRDAIREEEKKRSDARIAILDIAAKVVVMLTGLVVWSALRSAWSRC